MLAMSNHEILPQTITVGRLANIPSRFAEGIEAAMMQSCREQGRDLQLTVDREVIYFSPEHESFAEQTAKDMSNDGAVVASQDPDWPNVTIINTYPITDNREMVTGIILVTAASTSSTRQLRKMRRAHALAQNTRFEKYGFRCRVPVPDEADPEA
jgi:hypothetical protein